MCVRCRCLTGPQVGLLTHRTVALPDVPCEAPWLHPPLARGSKECAVPVNYRFDRYV